jgi:hypothetical protein
MLCFFSFPEKKFLLIRVASQSNSTLGTRKHLRTDASSGDHRLDDSDGLHQVLRHSISIRVNMKIDYALLATDSRS